MTSAQVVETSVTNNSSFQNYSHPDDHTIRTTDTPGFKPFTKFPLRYQVIGKGQQFVVSTKTMHVTLFLLQRYLVGSRYKYIPNDTAEVCCNTHLDKLPTKPKKSHFNHTALKFWVRWWIHSPGTNISVRKMIRSN